MASILTLQDQALWLARKRFGARKISKALDCHYITAANAVRKFERELREYPVPRGAGAVEPAITHGSEVAGSTITVTERP